MPTYVTLMKWTEQGIKDVNTTVDRAERARQAIEQAGGRMASIYWTQGAYDIVAIADFPDEETAMAWLLSLGKLGNVRTETLRAFSADEMRRILGKVR
ncbi:MAG TPA: GYD domain-containing protein [Chloroflexota bacterium]|nr:GYD domain-containing protein [Chloroflexota bacterium]